MGFNVVFKPVINDYTRVNHGLKEIFCQKFNLRSKGSIEIGTEKAEYLDGLYDAGDEGIKDSINKIREAIINHGKIEIKLSE